jgi:predicted aspartyl protease
VRPSIAVTFVVAVGLCCAAPGGEEAGKVEPNLADLASLYEAHDYFRLRDRLKAIPNREDSELLFYTATVQHAFNEPAESNRTIRRFFAADGGADSRGLELRRIQRNNHFRLFQYREAAEVSRVILAAPLDLSNEDGRKDDENMDRLLNALSEVPAQDTTVNKATTIKMERAPSGGLRVPLHIGEAHRAFLPDTGANLSALMRSEADALGFPIRGVGLEVGTATEAKVTADLTVVDRLTIGDIELRHVVFLVLPDALLSVPEANVRIPGIIGFPVLEAMGEVRFTRDGTLQVPASPSDCEIHNLALELLVPLVLVRYGVDSFVCRFDTGANRTAFYQPFYRKYRSEVETQGERLTSKTAGVGGVQEIEAYRLPRMDLTIGGRLIPLVGVDVYTEIITEEDDNYLFCNIGQDVLEPLDGYTLNFRSMSLLLE